MLVHPATPFIVGTAIISSLVWSLSRWSPMPNDLSQPHASIEGTTALEGCATCHTATGLAQGCLSCHGEIASQLDRDRGYHNFLLGEATPYCGSCHSEHNGAHFDLINDAAWGAQVARSFKHPHVAFKLAGKHSRIACEACHSEEQRAAFPPLPAFPLGGKRREAGGLSDKGGMPITAETPRAKTFLGLDQACARCHKDPHAEGLSGDCARCHGQESFKPPHFDHGKLFPLTGPHATNDCKVCHDLPVAGTRPQPPPFPFDHAKGKTCAGCHDTPHTAFLQGCEGCHPGVDPVWATALGRMTAVKHEPTGFRLRGPHENVKCEKCHARELPFERRYRDRSAPGYIRTEETCQGCHKDVHEGQFAGRYDRCLDCHDSHRFQPPTFGLEAHARRYPLTGAHNAVACISCHKVDDKTKVRRFAGTDKTCKSCHASPHGPQFQKQIKEKDCIACHEPTAQTFKIQPWDHAQRTGYRLEGAHYHMAKCEGCHRPVQMTFAGKVADIRRYEKTPKECSQCHRDGHRGQFDLYGKDSCNRCHASAWSWKDYKFNHDTQSRFPLEGSHAKVACDRCHVPVSLKDGTKVIQYRPLGMECRSCHDIPTAGNK